MMIRTVLLTLSSMFFAVSAQFKKSSDYVFTNSVEDIRGGASLRVTYPPSLVQTLGPGGLLKSSLGNFGHIQYGSTISAHLTYSPENVRGCEPFNNYFEKNRMVLVQAGECPITTKVRNIEKAGGQLAIIGDAFFEKVEDVFLEDVDGSGFSLTIPALLISKDDAFLLKTELDNNETIKLKANLEISKTDSR